jgi:anti-sigma factor RsiW
VNCKGVVVEISEYLDGSLDPALKHELEGHLKNCKKCRLIVDTTQKTIDIFCNSEPVALPKDVKQRLHQALANRLSKRPTQQA